MKTEQEVLQKSLELRARMYDNDVTKIQAVMLKEFDEILQWVLTW